MADGVSDLEVEARRPGVLILVYTWDLLLALAAVFGALAAFGGRLVVGDQSFDVPVPLQVVAALQSAAFAAALISVATLLTRRVGWVRRAQIVLLATHIGLIVVSVATARVISARGTDYGALLGNLLVVLINATAILALTGRRVREWYLGPGETPLYARTTIAFWAGSSAALIVFQAFR